MTDPSSCDVDQLMNYRQMVACCRVWSNRRKDSLTSMHTYKYVGATYADKVIRAPDHVTLKCSTPNQFNDPYELFLTIDFNDKPEILAFYSEIVGELPQLPTTCFSHSPIVLPMWAHYAQNLEGFVIEFDESKLAALLPERGFDDVDYRDGPDSDMEPLIDRAYEIGKFRYIYLLRQSIFSAAYYTKATCWNYEEEKRLILNPEDIREEHGMMLLDIPRDCVSAIIAGPRASKETTDIVSSGANQLGCNYFEMKVGKCTATPYLVDSNNKPHNFDGDKIVACSNQCSSCNEPIAKSEDLCSWCQIDDSHLADAADRNTFRMLHSAGMLEDYIESMNDISRGRAKDDE